MPVHKRSNSHGKPGSGMKIMGDELKSHVHNKAKSVKPLKKGFIGFKLDKDFHSK